MHTKKRKPQKNNKLFAKFKDLKDELAATLKGKNLKGDHIQIGSNQVSASILIAMLDNIIKENQENIGINKFIHSMALNIQVNAKEMG